MTRKYIGIYLFSCLSLPAFNGIAQEASGEAPTQAPVTVAEQPPPNVVVLQPLPTVMQPSPSHAQAPQAPVVYVYELPPPPAYAYAPPPPPPPLEPKKEEGVHTHDGFYLRMGLGAGVISLNQPSDGEASLSTGGAAVEFGMGGTLGDGFVVGARVIGVGGDNLRLESGRESSNVVGRLSYSTLQAFADWYIDPESGFHFELAFGPAGIRHDAVPTDRSSGTRSELSGMGGSIGFGIEGWVGEQWSLGGLLRLNWATFDGEFDAGSPDELLRAGMRSADEREREHMLLLSPMLMLTATFH